MTRSNIFLILLTAGILAAVGLSLLATRPAASDGCRGSAGRTLHVTIQDDRASSPDITGKYCDKLTFTNQDKVTREIAFGPHDNHTPYDGIAQKILNQGQSFTITLDRTGTYHWHDHEHDTVEGYFTVRR